MHIAVDSSRLERHLELLHEELQIAEQIEDIFYLWYQSALSNPGADPSFAREQLLFSRKVVSNILHRIELLKSIDEKAFMTTCAMEKKMDEASGQLHHLADYLI